MTTPLDRFAPAIPAGGQPDADCPYTLLGVTPGASPDLALQMYWRRVAELRDREQGGDSATVGDLERLNEALTVILRGPESASGHTDDPDGTAPSEDASPAAARSAWRRGATPGGLAALTIAGTCVAVGAMLPMVALVPTGVALLLLGRSGRSAEDRALSPFETLELASHATPDDVDLAYRTLVSRWLGRLTVDPERAIQMLDAFERAYPEAIQAAVARTAEAADAPRPRQPVRGVDPVERNDDTPVRLPASSGAGVDIEQRLQAAFAAVGDEVPRAQDLAGARFALVIQAAAGSRRIPVEGRPITVGAGGEFDIAVGAAPAEGPRPYGRLWVNGRDLVLHASAAAACRVNGEPSSWARLEDGDEIEIAGLQIRVLSEAGAPATA